jgi:endonuclease YncB( thermonuclease family)
MLVRPAGTGAPDADGLAVDPLSDLRVRLLGVDLPELALPLPGGPTAELFDARWEDFLGDAFASRWGAFAPPLTDALRAELEPRLGPGCAENQATRATAARQAFAGLIAADDPAALRLTFAVDVLDRDGRLLAHVHPGDDARSYNQRLLETGMALPHFVWPNVGPYLGREAIVDAVPAPGQVRPPGAPVAEQGWLEDSRAAAGVAREAGRGVWSGLRLLPFELRYLARRRPPERWVIDLSAGDDVIRHPQRYWEIGAPEDRLFVPAHYVPLFEAHGWRRADVRVLA